MNILPWMAAETAIAVATTAILTITSLIWGANLLGAPGRFHLAALTAVLALTALAFSRRIAVKKGSKLVAAIVSAALFLAAGIGLGAWDHLLKVVLTAHGMPASLMALVIPPAFGGTGDVFYEALGIAVLPAAIWGLSTLRTWFRTSEEA